MYAYNQPRPLVLADALSGRTSRDVAIVLTGAALVGVSAQVVVPLPFSPVPLSLQTFAVLVTAAAAGPSRATLALLLYAAAGVLGVPWFAGGKSGFGEPTFGYVLGFIAAAAVAGALARRGADRTVARTIALMVLGNLVIYACGVSWLAASTGIASQQALAVGVLPFLIGDAMKVLLAAAVLPGAWRLVGPDESRSPRGRS